jgi:hypothetical protein
MKYKILLLEKFLLPFLLSLIMTAIISFVSTIKAIGFENFMISDWYPAWFWSWTVAFPSILLVLPVVRRFVQSLIEKEKNRNNIE